MTLLVVLTIPACRMGGERVEYIPGDRALVPLQKDQPAPADGWFVPPALMQELVPLLERRFQAAPPPSTPSVSDRSQ